MSIGKRLKDERTRLGYNQTDFAAIYGVSKKSQIDYEKDSFSPTAKQLEVIGKCGADIIYILTGYKIDFSSDEMEMLTLFRQASLENKFRAVQALKGELPAVVKQQFNDSEVGNVIEKHEGNITVDFRKKREK